MKIGIDLGGSHIAIGLVDENGELLDIITYYIREEHKDNIQKYITDSIVTGVVKLIENNKIGLSNIISIGIATPGNPKDGCIRNVVNLRIDDFPITAMLKSEFEKQYELSNFTIPIYLKNDGKCAGLAEKEYGSLKEYEDCVFLCIGTGIGGATFYHNEFLQPKRNAGFEFGHMVIQKCGNRCNCGNYGCFETYGSMKRFKNKLKEILNLTENYHSEELIPIIRENENRKEVSFLIEEYIDYLALGICNIINILEPEAISLGGSFAHYEELFYEPLKQKIQSGVYLFNKREVPDLIIAKFQNDAGIIGATLI